MAIPVDALLESVVIVAPDAKSTIVSDPFLVAPACLRVIPLAGNPLKLDPSPSNEVAVTTPMIVAPPETTLTPPAVTTTPVLAVTTPTESILVTSSYDNVPPTVTFPVAVIIPT